MKLFKQIVVLLLLFSAMAFGVAPNTTQGIMRDVSQYGQHALGMSEVKINRELIDYYLIFYTDTTAITDTTLIGDNYIIVDAITGADSGDVVNIYQDDRLFQCLVDSAYGDTVILDIPLDVNLDTNGIVYFGDWDMADTARTYRLTPPNGAVWNINNIVLTLTDTGTFTINTFGAFSGGLDDGCVFKVSNATTKNVFNLRDNLNFIEFMNSYILDTSTFAVTGSEYLIGYKSFDPATILLNGTSGHYIEFIVQDDLSSSGVFSITAHGVRQDE